MWLVEQKTFITFRWLPLAGNVERSPRNVHHAEPNDSTTDFFQRVIAPTLPPVRNKTLERRDEACNKASSIGFGAEPSKNFDESTVKRE